MRFCEVCGRSDSEITIKKRNGKDLCPKHEMQIRNYGRIFDVSIQDRNSIEIYDDHAEIILRNRRCEENGRA